MPNRLKKAVTAPQKPILEGPRLKGFRDAILSELKARDWSYMDLVREAEKRGEKLDDDYLRRMMNGQRFNEENISLIADILQLPVYVGDLPKPVVRVEMHPAMKSAKGKERAENVPVPVLPISLVIQKPFRYDPWKVKDWAYINWLAFQAFNVDKMACVKLSMETEAPLVRKEAMVCICMETMPPAGPVSAAPVWAARQGNDLVIGHYEEQKDAILLTRKIPAGKSSAIASREDIVGRVCWVWHSLV